jgi:pimeloyl-ACP methyl ester carboxylesterase
MVIAPDLWLQQGRSAKTRVGSFHVREKGSGPPVLLLHGFPTWSWDWAAIADDLGRATVAPDLLGYGFSDKQGRYPVGAQADALEDLVAALDAGAVDVVAHDYGTIVAQELLDRQRQGRLPFRVGRVALLNAGIVHSAYRPTRFQRLLAVPFLGRAVAATITPARTRVGLDGILGPGRYLSGAEFDGLWQGMAHQGGHRLAHRLIRYNAERARHAPRWEAALAAFDDPLLLVWGMADPVSGAHVLALAREAYHRARVVELDGVGHYPHLEAPEQVAAALRTFLA